MFITGSARPGSLVETGAEPTHPEGSKDIARKNTKKKSLPREKSGFITPKCYAQMLRPERSLFRSQFGSPCPSTRTPSEPAAVMPTRAPSVMISLSFPQRKPHRRQNASQNTPQNAPQLPSLQMHRSRQQNQVTSIDAAIHLLRRRTSTDAASFSTDVDTSSLPTDEDASSVASGEASPTPLSSGRRLPQPRVETSALPWWASGARLKSVPGTVVATVWEHSSASIAPTFRFSVAVPVSAVDVATFAMRVRTVTLL